MKLIVRPIEVTDLPDLAYAEDYPTQGPLAVLIWETLSGNRIAASEAKVLYRQCGYEPFSGYPLKRI